MFFNASIDSVWQVLGSPAKTQICILFPRMIKRNLENQIMGSSSTVSFCLLKNSGLNYLSSGACRLWGSSVTPSLSTLFQTFSSHCQMSYPHAISQKTETELPMLIVVHLAITLHPLQELSARMEKFDKNTDGLLWAAWPIKPAFLWSLWELVLAKLAQVHKNNPQICSTVTPPWANCNGWKLKAWEVYYTTLSGGLQKENHKKRDKLATWLFNLY